MTIYDYVDISEKHTFKYNPLWKGIKCPIKFHKNKTGYESIVTKHKITGTKYMYIGSTSTIKSLDSLMIYCDYNRSQYPVILGIDHIHADDEIQVLEALFQRGYRIITREASYRLPETKYLFLYRDRTEILDKIS